MVRRSVMSQIDNQIRARIEEFVADLSQLVRDSAVEAAVAALKGSAGQRSSAPSSKTKKSRVVTGGGGRRTGKRRSPREIERTLKTVADHIKKNPSQRAEDIRKALKLSPAETGDALKRLVENKSIKSKGERRQTTYSSS